MVILEDMSHLLIFNNDCSLFCPNTLRYGQIHPWPNNSTQNLTGEQDNKRERSQWALTSKSGNHFFSFLTDTFWSYMKVYFCACLNQLFNFRRKLQISGTRKITRKFEPVKTGFYKALTRPTLTSAGDHKKILSRFSFLSTLKCEDHELCQIRVMSSTWSKWVAVLSGFPSVSCLSGNRKNSAAVGSPGNTVTNSCSGFTPVAWRPGNRALQTQMFKKQD